MNNSFYYELSIAGLKALYIMPYPVTIVDSSEPFMQEVFDSAGGYDLTVTVSESSQLKSMAGDEYHIVDCYYSRQKPFRMKGYEVWRCTDLEGIPYAHMLWKDEKRAEIAILPEYRHYLNMSRQLLNLTGIENWLIANHGFILHASLIDYQGQGILFSAASGTGKSTQADLWARYRGADILNGDRAGIMKKDGRWIAYGLPFAGSSGIYRNESVEVSVLVMLSQGRDNVAVKLPRFRSEMLMFPQIVTHRWDEGAVSETMNLLDEFATDIPVYSFSCRPDEEAVEVIRSLPELSANPDKRSKRIIPNRL